MQTIRDFNDNYPPDRVEAARRSRLYLLMKRDPYHPEVRHEMQQESRLRALMNGPLSEHDS
jgi:hypothetical protein